MKHSGSMLNLRRKFRSLFPLHLDSITPSAEDVTWTQKMKMSSVKLGSVCYWLDHISSVTQVTMSREMKKQTVVLYNMFSAYLVGYIISKKDR